MEKQRVVEARLKLYPHGYDESNDFPDNRRGDEVGTTNRVELDADFGRGDHIFLDRTKIDVPVYVVIPNAVGEALRMLPNAQG